MNFFSVGAIFYILILSSMLKKRFIKNINFLYKKPIKYTFLIFLIIVASIPIICLSGEYNIFNFCIFNFFDKILSIIVSVETIFLMFQFMDYDDIE